MVKKFKAACLSSLTIAWGYCLALAGAALQVIDSVADALGDPGLREQIDSAVGDAKTAGRILLGISVITIIARLRSLRRAG
jgi:hypothetical protein